MVKFFLDKIAQELFRLIFIVNYGALIVGCSAIPTIVERQNLTYIKPNDIREFSVVGKLALSTKTATKTNAIQARFYWQEKPQTTNILIETPMGVNIGNIIRDENSTNNLFNLTRGDEILIQKNSLEEILTVAISEGGENKIAQTNFPKGILTDIILGRNQDKWRVWGEKNQEVNWQIEYKNSAGGINNTPQLPEFLLINNQDFNIRIFIEQWLEIK